MPTTDRYPFRADIRGKLVEAASSGRTLSYLELGVGRAMIGRYLMRIAEEEAKAGRPPLTAVVVRKDTGRPASGFLEAMASVRFVSDTVGEDEREVWGKALREVFEFWRPKLRDDLQSGA